MEESVDPLKIMIVDDSPGMRAIMRSLLREHSAEFSECDDGEEAIALYAAERPDWVLMDIRMPRLDGLGAMRRILEDHPKARFIVVTDYDDQDIRAEASALGVKGYVLKDNLGVLPALMQERIDDHTSSEE